MKYIVIIALLFMSLIPRLSSQLDTTKYKCQYKLNNNSFIDLPKCEIYVYDIDRVELRVVNKQNYRDTFQVWKSPKGRIDTTSMLISQNLDRRYGKYKVKLQLTDKDFYEVFTVNRIKGSPGTTLSDDLKKKLGGDSDNDFIPDLRDCAPNDPSLPSSLTMGCDDGNDNTINDRILKGQCQCKGELKKDSSTKNDCSIIGFWWGPDRRFESNYDINNSQIILRESVSASQCPPRFIFDYTRVKDTLFLNGNDYRNLKLLIRFINCNHVHLIDIERRGLILNGTIVLNRADGMLCDCPSNYVMDEKFVIKEGSFLDNLLGEETSRTTKRTILVILYFSFLLNIVVGFIRKKPKKSIYNFIFFIGVICLFLSFIEWAFFYLFTIHICLYAKYILKKITIINVLGNVVIYSVVAGVIVIIEYILRFGLIDIGNQWMSLVPVIALIIGASLIKDFYSFGYRTTRYPTKYLLIMAILVYGFPQGYIASQKTHIIEWVKANKDKLPDFSSEAKRILKENKEKCPK